MTEVRSSTATAYDALALAKEAKRDVAMHEDICAERYRNIQASLDKMETSFDKQLGMVWKVIAWAGGSAFMIVMGLLAFLAKTQFDSIAALQKAAVQRGELERIQATPPQVVIQRVPGHAEVGATVEQHPAR